MYCTQPCRAWTSRERAIFESTSIQRAPPDPILLMIEEEKLSATQKYLRADGIRGNERANIATALRPVQNLPDQLRGRQDHAPQFDSTSFFVRGRSIGTRASSTRVA